MIQYFCSRCRRDYCHENNKCPFCGMIMSESQGTLNGVVMAHRGGFSHE